MDPDKELEIDQLPRSPSVSPQFFYTIFKILKFEEMHKLKLLSVIFKLVHTPDEFPEALKELFTQHFQVH